MYNYKLRTKLDSNNAAINKIFNSWFKVIFSL